MRKIFSLTIAALALLGSVAVAGPKVVRECPGGNCPNVQTYSIPAVNYSIPQSIPATDPDRIIVNGVQYVKAEPAEAVAPKRPSIRPEPKTPEAKPAEVCLPCSQALPVASYQATEYQEPVRRGLFGSCGSSAGRLSLGVCGSGGRGPIRTLIRGIFGFGGCGG
jgi:hypothetical protein